MISLKEYLKTNTLITDGAMGTYYASMTTAPTMVERENLNNPNIIKNIHKAYIKNGARIIRTNTFMANPSALDNDYEYTKKIIISGYNIAKEAIDNSEVYIACDIGPIHELDNQEEVIKAYLHIIDSFLEVGGDIFWFETFSDYKYFEYLSEYIKKKNSNAYVVTSFTVDSTGHTRNGIHYKKLLNKIRSINTIDAYGFNCSVGPTHLRSIIKELEISKEKVFLAMPNAGYPQVVSERTVYQTNPKYFKDILSSILDYGVKIIGGCCGTNPEYIKELSTLSLAPHKGLKLEKKVQTTSKQSKKVKNSFFNKLNSNKRVTLCELDPPYSSDISKLLDCAIILKNANIDLVTISDSPLGKSRVDSILTAAKIKSEIGIDTMAHVCLRDKNIIALKANLLGAHMWGLRNILCVTGDPVPTTDRGEIKSVFNLNAIKLINLINTMNEDTFANDPWFTGGALNINAHSLEIELSRTEKKYKAGAKFFLTQPVFDTSDSTRFEMLKDFKNKYPDLKIMLGIMPLVNYRNAMFLNNEVPGINIPDESINLFDQSMTREDAEKIGIRIACNTIKEVHKYFDGVYFVAPFNRASMIAKIKDFYDNI